MAGEYVLYDVIKQKYIAVSATGPKHVLSQVVADRFGNKRAAKQYAKEYNLRVDAVKVYD